MCIGIIPCHTQGLAAGTKLFSRDDVAIDARLLQGVETGTEICKNALKLMYCLPGRNSEV